jgi:predicted NUDIX family phosphoesterase
MMKKDQMIMVTTRKELFASDYFQGFRPAREVDYESRLLLSFSYLRRGEMEIDPSWKQPIGYALIVNRSARTVFAYQRSSKEGEYHETRLMGKWSWGVGGHIEKCDQGDGNPIRASMIREVGEEIGLKSSGEPEVLGYINDDSDPVGKVHFGVLYVIPTVETIVHPACPELKEGGMRAAEELAALVSQPGVIVEEWSKISLPPLLEYLGRPASPRR